MSIAKYLMSVVVVSSFYPITAAKAVIIKGNMSFSDNAFADSATVVSGSVGNGRPLSEILAGPDLATGLGIGDFDSGELIEVNFTDSSIINRPGYDLVVYEKHSEDGFDVALQIAPSLFSSFLHYEPSRQSFSEGGYVNAAFIDLSDFGLAPLSTISTIRVLEDDYDSAELAGFASIHSSVPEPGTVILGLLALLGLVTQRRSAFCLE